MFILLAFNKLFFWIAVGQSSASVVECSKNIDVSDVSDFCRFSSFDEENVQFCCENIAAHVEHTLEWEREMVIKRQQKVL